MGNSDGSVNRRHESEISYNELARGFDESVKAFDESLAIFHAIPTRQPHTFTSRKRWIDESFLKHLSRHTTMRYCISSSQYTLTYMHSCGENGFGSEDCAS